MPNSCRILCDLSVSGPGSGSVPVHIFHGLLERIVDGLQMEPHGRVQTRDSKKTGLINGWIQMLQGIRGDGSLFFTMAVLHEFAERQFQFSIFVSSGGIPKKAADQRPERINGTSSKSGGLGIGMVEYATVRVFTQFLIDGNRDVVLLAAAEYITCQGQAFQSGRFHVGTLAAGAATPPTSQTGMEFEIPYLPVQIPICSQNFVFQVMYAH